MKVFYIVKVICIFQLVVYTLQRDEPIVITVSCWLAVHGNAVLTEVLLLFQSSYYITSIMCHNCALHVLWGRFCLKEIRYYLLPI